jgi:tocopherol O-methyltransferase
VASPSLWALAFTQGKDFVAFLKAFQSMRTGYKNGTFRYAVMVFELA